MVGAQKVSSGGIPAIFIHNKPPSGFLALGYALCGLPLFLAGYNCPTGIQSVKLLNAL